MAQIVTIHVMGPKGKALSNNAREPLYVNFRDHAKRTPNGAKGIMDGGAANAD